MTQMLAEAALIYDECGRRTDVILGPPLIYTLLNCHRRLSNEKRLPDNGLIYAQLCSQIQYLIQFSQNMKWHSKLLSRSLWLYEQASLWRARPSLTSPIGLWILCFWRSNCIWIKGRSRRSLQPVLSQSQAVLVSHWRWGMPIKYMPPVFKD